MNRVKEDLLKVIAANVRALRATAGLSQEALAERCGLHRTYIGGIERAERNITVLSLEKIASALNVPPASLLTPGRGPRV